MSQVELHLESSWAPVAAVKVSAHRRQILLGDSVPAKMQPENI